MAYFTFIRGLRVSNLLITIDSVNIIKREVGGFHLTGLTPPHVCACPKAGPEFPTSYVTCDLSYVQ
jgi:hypothetical protein